MRISCREQTSLVVPDKKSRHQYLRVFNIENSKCATRIKSELYLYRNLPDCIDLVIDCRWISVDVIVKEEHILGIERAIRHAREHIVDLLRRSRR